MRRMTDYSRVARDLAGSLDLKLAPIAVSLVDEVPGGIEPFSGTVAGGCRFWQEAATRVFSTSTADHARCAIGVYTHNMDSPPEQATEELGQVLKVMSDLTYVREQDVAAIPRLGKPVRHVVYAPLADTPVDPDAVIVFADAQQGLIVAEAAQQVEQGLAPALGRPACAVVPQVVNTGRAAVSLGCCGARAYLDALTDDVALWALPGQSVASYAERIAALSKANSVLAQFHERRRKDIEAGQTPSFEQSLSRAMS